MIRCGQVREYNLTVQIRAYWSRALAQILKIHSFAGEPGREDGADASSQALLFSAQGKILPDGTPSLMLTNAHRRIGPALIYLSVCQRGGPRLFIDAPWGCDGKFPFAK